MTILAATLVLLLCLLTAAGVLAARTNWRMSKLAVFLVVSSVVITVRVGAFWVLTYLEWTHQQTLSALPLVFLMYPEALVFPEGHTLTWTSATLFTLLLVASGCALGGIAAWRVPRSATGRAINH